MVSYSVFFKADAEKELRKTPFPFRRQANQRIHGLKSDPRPAIATEIEDGRYRLDVAALRIYYEIDDEARTVTVFSIRHDPRS